jgi:hypothetical protein
VSPFWRRIAKVLLGALSAERLRSALHGLSDAIVDAMEEAARDPVKRHTPRSLMPDNDTPTDPLAQARAAKVEAELKRRGIV